MEFFDTHAHYDDKKFDEDREKILEKIYNEKVTKVINVGCDFESSIKSIEMAKSYEFLYAMCGIHPSDIKSSKEEIEQDILKIEELIKKSEKVVAVGEIGLDYYWHNDNKELQKLCFIKQIELSNRLGLPISIHTRDAIDDTIEILRSHEINKSGVLHCCPFNRELVKHGLDAGLYIAFGGTCTFKNSKNTSEIVNMVPRDKILIETDSPYLAPDPVRGTRNDSSNLKYVVSKIAEFRGESEDEVAKLTFNNAKVLFGV